MGEFKKTRKRKCFLCNAIVISYVNRHLTSHVNSYLLLPYIYCYLSYQYNYTTGQKKLAAHRFEFVLGMILSYLDNLGYADSA